jgi:hypothetical protein
LLSLELVKITCRTPEFRDSVSYGRGPGYPWKYEYGFSEYERKQREACERDRGINNCEEPVISGVQPGIWYPKCKPGIKQPVVIRVN